MSSHPVDFIQTPPEELLGEMTEESVRRALRNALADQGVLPPLGMGITVEEQRKLLLFKRELDLEILQMKLELKAGCLSLERQRSASIREGKMVPFGAQPADPPKLNVAKDLRPALPDEDVTLMLGYNLAGGHIWLDESPLPVVTDTPNLDSTTDEVAQQYPEVVTACAMTCSASQEGDPKQVEQTNDNLSLAEYRLEVSQEDLLEEQQETAESEQVVVNTDHFINEPVVQVVVSSPPAHSSCPMVAASDDELRGPEDCALQEQLKESEMLRDSSFIPKQLNGAQRQELVGISKFVLGRADTT